jgi:hypothetical protein
MAHLMHTRFTTRILQMSQATNAPLIAENHWETRWNAAEAVFDPAYERTNAALRRWVDGMEQALIANMNRRSRATRA